MKVTFTVLILSFCCSLAHASHLLIDNIKGYTLKDDGKLTTFSSMLIQGGKVSALNPDSQTIPVTVQRIDGEGRVLLPGLIDAHGHMLGLGANLRQVDLRDTRSEGEAVARVKQAVASSLGQTWIVGRGWNQELWTSRRFPTAATLDDIPGDQPIWLQRIDGHAGWANTAALNAAGIDDTTPDPEGGKIIRDDAGKATGVLIDNAMTMVEAQLPTLSKETLRTELQLAGEHLLALGITGMHDAGISKQVYDFYMIQALQQSMPIRIYAMVSATDPLLDEMLANGIVQSADDMLHIRSVKAYGDGALGSRGAALLKPYSDQPSESGLLLTSNADVIPLFGKVLGAGFQLNYHAIGDKANRVALDTFERIYKTLPAKALRNRIEHAQVIDVNDLKRFAELGVLPSMQPTHATSDMNMAEDRVGSERIVGAYAWKTLWDSGAKIPLGSDFPVELANPFYGLHAAVTRQDRSNQPLAGWFANEALTIEQAFDGFTRTAAYAAHMEDKVGTLLPGQWADFIFVDQDIFSIEAKDIWRTQVLSTWIAGEKKFDANVL